MSISVPFRPPHAVVCWTDGMRIFVELPASSGDPFVLDYELTEGGLTKALNLLRTRHHEAKSNGTVLEPKKPDTRIKRKAPEVTEEQKVKARETLKKLGLI